MKCCVLARRCLFGLWGEGVCKNDVFAEKMYLDGMVLGPDDRLLFFAPACFHFEASHCRPGCVELRFGGHSTEPGEGGRDEDLAECGAHVGLTAILPVLPSPCPSHSPTPLP